MRNIEAKSGLLCAAALSAETTAEAVPRDLIRMVYGLSRRIVVRDYRLSAVFANGQVVYGANRTAGKHQLAFDVFAGVIGVFLTAADVDHLGSHIARLAAGGEHRRNVAIAD